ncbi:MAG: hypothetical protein LBF01_04925 [Bacteroidales bacterium]|jgi:hypothetical protein|nr:hypothetical protein [Bacteroidales bacterium]
MNIMHKNDHQIRDFDAVLDKRYGKHGTSERAKFDEEAYTFYSSLSAHFLTTKRERSKNALCSGVPIELI